MSQLKIVHYSSSEYVTSTLERHLLLAYAIVIVNDVYKCVKETNDFQDVHEDTYMSTTFYDVLFDEACHNIDEARVLEKWRYMIQEDSSMQDICPLYFLKYQCSDYRNMHFKTEDRRKSIKMCVHKLLKLQKRFVMK
jgi:hypothetical protein